MIRLRSHSAWALFATLRRTSFACFGAFAALLSTPAMGLDLGADGEFSARSSSHFELLQDVDIDRTGGFHGSRRFEQQILAELERAYEKLDNFLGLRPKRKIVVVIYDAGVFDQQFARLIRFPAAGFYHGVIRIRGATQLDVNLSRVLHHELVHAALDAEIPSFVIPAWVNEGLAEWFEARAQGKRHLNGPESQFLSQAHREGVLFSLATLSTPSFSHLGPNAAQLAYVESYGMVEFLANREGERSLRELCDGLVRTKDLERTLRRVYREDLKTLESEFFAELG